MKKHIYLNLICGLVATVLLYGCAGTTSPDTKGQLNVYGHAANGTKGGLFIPDTKAAQNIERYQARADIGKFAYIPANNGIVKQNQIQSAMPSMEVFIDGRVSDFARNINIQNLGKNGFTISTDSPIKISGEILELKLTKYSKNVSQELTCAVRYTITQKSNSTVLHNKIYSGTAQSFWVGMPPGLVTPQMESASIKGNAEEGLRRASNEFMRDEEVRKIFSK